MKSGYFKHFRLIDFVLRNNQMPTFKNITLFHDEPLKMPSLDFAKEVVDEDDMRFTHHDGEGDMDMHHEGEYYDGNEGMIFVNFKSYEPFVSNSSPIGGE